MKKAIIIAGLFFTLAACNESGQQSATNNTSDTASHSAHGNNSAANGTTGDGGVAGRTSDQNMMSLMENNMDQMKQFRSLGSNDKDFAGMMKIHHMGAVEMARLQLAQGTDQQVKSMAQKVLDDQQKEIGQLDAFLNNNNQNSAAQSKSSPFYDRVMKEMDNMKMDDTNHSGSVDQQFVQMMIPHHQGGIAMANLYLKNSPQDQSLRSMANKIKTDQQKEIQQMQAWQASHKQ